MAQSVTEFVSEVGCCDRGDSCDMVHMKQRITVLDSKDLIAGRVSISQLGSCWNNLYQNC